LPLPTVQVEQPDANPLVALPEMPPTPRAPRP
jgi:hypothetical protein